MQELLIATKNPGKYSEIMEVVGGLDYEFIFLGDLDLEDGDFEEDGETFEENAKKKAQYYHEKTGFLSLAEDSGIVVNALRGELGLKTRRWGAGENATDEEWIEFFMNRMKEEEERKAKFVCAACVFGFGNEEYFRGETHGTITASLQAPILKGLPLSSCFLPNGQERVYAALEAQEKNEISHRGKAIFAVRDFLADLG